MTRDTFDHFQPQERGLFGDNEQRESESQVTKSNLCDLELTLHVETANAILVSAGVTKVWLPKSQIDFEDLSDKSREVRGHAPRPCRVTAPRWLAKEKGLI